MKRVYGIDPSLLATGAAWCTVGEAYAHPSTEQALPIWRSARTWKTPVKLFGAERLLWIKANLIDDLARGVDLLVLEGYSYDSPASKGGRAFDIGELGGMIKLTALERGVTVLIVTPGERIEYTTQGALNTRSGTDKLKAESVRLAISELGTDKDIDDNQADALWLAEIGMDVLDLALDLGVIGSHRSDIVRKLRMTPAELKEVARLTKVKEAERTIEADRKKQEAKARKPKQYELFTTPTGERVFSGPGPVPAREINGTA